jgi:hypothetical protein
MPAMVLLLLMAGDHMLIEVHAIGLPPEVPDTSDTVSVFETVN